MLFSFITLVTDQLQYRSFKSSVLSDIGHPENHQFIPIDNTGNHYSAAGGLNAGIKAAKGKYLICCHQDIMCNNGWLKNIHRHIEILERYDKRWGVLGVAGEMCQVKGGVVSFNSAGTVGGFQKTDGSFYRPVQTVDELCLIIRREACLFFDEKTFTHFHFYGADISLLALSKGLQNYSLMVDTTHLSDGSSNILQHFDKFRQEARKLYLKWYKLFPNFATTTTWFLLGKLTYWAAKRENILNAEESIEEIVRFCELHGIHKKDLNSYELSSPQISIILHDAHNTNIKQVFSAYGKQSENTNRFELIFCSGDKERIKLAQNMEIGCATKMIYHEQQNAAVLKNKGIKAAKGALLLFTSGTVIPDVHFIENHINAHIRYNSPTTAIFGRVEVCSENGFSPLVSYIATMSKEIPFFCKDNHQLDWHNFNLYNVSIKSSFLGEAEFDDNFLYESYEGHMVACGLMRKGLHMSYAKSAIVFFTQNQSHSQFAAYMYQLGIMAYFFYSILPGSIDFGNLFTDPMFIDSYFNEKMITFDSAAISKMESECAVQSPNADVQKKLFDFYDTLAYAAWCKGALEGRKIMSQ